MSTRVSPGRRRSIARASRANASASSVRPCRRRTAASPFSVRATSACVAPRKRRPNESASVKARSAPAPSRRIQQHVAKSVQCRGDVGDNSLGEATAGVRGTFEEVLRAVIDADRWYTRPISNIASPEPPAAGQRRLNGRSCRIEILARPDASILAPGKGPHFGTSPTRSPASTVPRHARTRPGQPRRECARPDARDHREPHDHEDERRGHRHAGTCSGARISGLGRHGCRSRRDRHAGQVALNVRIELFDARVAPDGSLSSAVRTIMSRSPSSDVAGALASCRERGRPTRRHTLPRTGQRTPRDARASRSRIACATSYGSRFRSRYGSRPVSSSCRSTPSA
jgi:hypothetical protein